MTLPYPRGVLDAETRAAFEAAAAQHLAIAESEMKAGHVPQANLELHLAKRCAQAARGERFRGEMLPNGIRFGMPPTQKLEGSS